MRDGGKGRVTGGADGGTRGLESSRDVTAGGHCCPRWEREVGWVVPQYLGGLGHGNGTQWDWSQRAAVPRTQGAAREGQHSLWPGDPTGWSQLEPKVQEPGARDGPAEHSLPAQTLAEAGRPDPVGGRTLPLLAPGDTKTRQSTCSQQSLRPHLSRLP